MLKFEQKIGDRYPVFFLLDNSDKAKFRSKSSSDNKNIKIVIFKYKIRIKNSQSYPIFLKSDKFEYSSRIHFCQRYLKKKKCTQDTEANLYCPHW